MFPRRYYRYIWWCPVFGKTDTGNTLNQFMKCFVIPCHWKKLTNWFNSFTINACLLSSHYLTREKQICWRFKFWLPIWLFYTANTNFCCLKMHNQFHAKSLFKQSFPYRELIKQFYFPYNVLGCVVILFVPSKSISFVW